MSDKQNTPPESLKRLVAIENLPPNPRDLLIRINDAVKGKWVDEPLPLPCEHKSLTDSVCDGCGFVFKVLY